MENTTDSGFKTCSQCGVTHLGTSEFFRKRSGGRGLEAICRDCTRVNARAYMQVKRANGFVRADKSRARRVEYVNKIKLERGCADCGFKGNVIALEFDHLPEFEVKARIADLFRIEDVDAEIAKCEVVCANCHKIRTAKRKQCAGRPVLPVPPELEVRARNLAVTRNYN